MLPLPESEEWMRQAIALAKSSIALGEVPVAAMLVHEGKVLSAAANTREQGKKTSGHAEMVALEAFNFSHGTWRLPPDTTLIVTVEPCLMCTGAMIAARLDHIIVGAKDTKDAGLFFLQPFIDSGKFDHKFKSVSDGVLGAECSAMLSEFFAMKRKLAVINKAI